MRFLFAASVLFLSACTANININARPSNAEIYVTEYAPQASEPPAAYVGRGTGSAFAPVSYFAWEDYYMWVGAPGYQTHISQVPGEVKVGPLIGGCFLTFPWVWVWGPTNKPIYVDLQPLN